MKKRSPKDITQQVKSSSAHSIMVNEDKIVSSNSDGVNFVVLLVLYCLQGIPMGLSSSIPLILKERNVSYESLSLFSLVSIPFSLKLLWAPFVDSLYFKSFGRRKSWLIPIQLITAAAMIVGSNFISGWLGETADGGHSGTLSVTNLTIYFVSLYFLMATQDIAVDGWALTMLSRENVGMASICNSVGQTVGVFLANQGFIALSDAQWCHRYLGMREGTTLINLAGFMNFWAYVFILTTLFVWFFKTEEPARDDEEHPDFTTTCKHIVRIFRLPPVRTLTVMLLTLKIAFAAGDAAFGFKLQEYGMPKADLATISPLLLGVGLVLPSVLSNIVATRPLDMLLVGVPMKIVTSASLWFILQTTKTAYANGVTPGLTFFGPLIGLLILHEVAGCLLFSSLMAYYSKISDPAIGGSYMTLLNTLTNLGSKWPSSLCLWILPKLTVTSCLMDVNGKYETINISCYTAGQACVEYGGVCSVTRDGYSIVTVGCFVFGVVWYWYYFKSSVKKLQMTPFDDWLIASVATPSVSGKASPVVAMKSS